MRHTELVVIMGFFEKIEIALEAVLAFPLLDLGLHGGDICREAKLLAIAEQHVVIWFAFDYVYSFGFQTCVEVGEGLVEQAREEKQRWALVEALSCCQSWTDTME